jgi:hypothetical protein
MKVWGHCNKRCPAPLVILYPHTARAGEKRPTPTEKKASLISTAGDVPSGQPWRKNCAGSTVGADFSCLATIITATHNIRIRSHRLHDTVTKRSLHQVGPVR